MIFAVLVTVLRPSEVVFVLVFRNQSDMEYFSAAYLISIAQIILIDIVLSGDNAVVIAMAAHKLPVHQRQRAILWGGGIAILLRVVFTLVMAFLLMIPGVRLIGGLVLVWIACKLLVDEEEHSVSADDADRSALAAIRMIFLADFVMSLDNMLAVAGASHGDWVRLLMGLLISVGIIMFFSTLIAKWMNRFRWIVYLGAAVLAFTAGEMILGDRELAGYVVRHFGVCINSHWDENFMKSRVEIASFRADDLPEDLRDAVHYEKKKLTFIGQMSEAQRDELLARVTPADVGSGGESPDSIVIKELFEETRPREVPAWMPNAVEPWARGWFQKKWPFADWQRVSGAHHHYVAWLFYAVVIAFCMSAPYWIGRGKSEPPPKPENAATGAA